MHSSYGVGDIMISPETSIAAHDDVRVSKSTPKRSFREYTDMIPYMIVK